MTDWYRRKTWTKIDEEEFFAKLGRARKDGRAQYLKIQAIELVYTKDKELLVVAEELLNKVLTEYPENRIEKSTCYNFLGQIYELRNDAEMAICFYKKSLDYEKEFPNVISGSDLDFSKIVVRENKIEFFDEVENIITEKIKKKSIIFPVQNYIMYSILAVISEFKGNFEQAKSFADIAEKNSKAEKNSLWNPRKQKIGIVENRINWLDKLVGRK
ncbi:tetratricopeptide repeat protein [Flavobacterium luteolum]|uniref:tetratricopeptide repeat protein n=1 Tax=Flavobacterium luteolum TaxID=3003259 RepID=UPI00248E8E3F|nr:tetratricopeptide repeat protein [Flavobacterium luteolum]